MPEIYEVSDTNFQAEVLEDDDSRARRLLGSVVRPVPRRSPRRCRRSPTDREDLQIVKLNVDDNQQTAAQYQVLAIPTMILFRNGQEAKRIQGAMPKRKIEAELDPALAA